MIYGSSGCSDVEQDLSALLLDVRDDTLLVASQPVRVGCELSTLRLNNTCYVSDARKLVSKRCY